MRKVIFALVVITITGSSFGGWTLLDDFQQFADGDVFTSAEDIGWHARSITWSDAYWMIGDPYDTTNIGMYVESGDYGISYGNVWAQKLLPGGGIAAGSTGTIFARCLWHGIDNSWHLGTADTPLSLDDMSGRQVTPGNWNDFNALIRLSTAKVLEYRNGGGFVPTSPPVSVASNEWYSFWIVINNTWDTSITPPRSTGTHTLYLQGPEDAGPVLIQTGTNPPGDSAFFRNAPMDDDGNPRNIIWLNFATSAGPPSSPNSGDLFLLDDLYYAPGTNLSNPLTAAGGWAGYSIVNEAGDVNTEDWLGWINIASAPHLFNYKVGWIYMEEPIPQAAGAWGFIYR